MIKGNYETAATIIMPLLREDVAMDEAFYDRLSEKDRRSYAALEAQKLEHGGESGSLQRLEALQQSGY